MGTVSEETMAKAKSFLGVFAQSLLCMQQAAEKQAHTVNSERFMKKVELSRSQGEIVLNSEGNLEFGYKFGYFSRLNEICEKSVIKRVTSYKILDNNALDQLISSLEADIESARKGKY